MTQIDLSANTRLARRFGSTLHVIEPTLRYRWIPWLSTDAIVSPTVDPQQDRRELHQWAVGLEQTLWSAEGANHSQLVKLVVEQPFAVEDLELLQTQIELEAHWGSRVQVKSWVDLDSRLNWEVQEFGTEFRAQAGPIRIGGNYGRWTPRADRLRRTLYELAAEGPTLQDDAWLHVFRASASLNIFGIAELGYGTAYLLSVPLEDYEPGFNQHSVSLRYNSPCNCWSVSMRASMPVKEDFKTSFQGLRAHITLAVGGYALGN